MGRLRAIDNRGWLTIILGGALLWSVLQVEWADGVMHSRGWSALGEIILAMFTPEVSAEVFGTLIEAAWRTLAYAVAGLSLALVVGFPLGVLASGVLMRPGAKRGSVQAAVRGVLGFFRAVHELVWAWLFVAAIGLSPTAAVLALAIPYAGILGRIYAELLQDVPEGPLRSLRASGASEWRVLWYGRMPILTSDLLSYTFYRLECGIRSAAILSFVGLGGIGFHIEIALDDLAYGRAWTFILGLIVLIVAVEAWSSAVRKRVAL